MKISTAEIKLLLKECVKTEGFYTVLDFCKYLSEKSDKIFTKSQVSGAIAQLIDTGDIVRVERGLYKRKSEETTKCLKENIKDDDMLFKQEAKQCLSKAERILAQFADSKNFMQVNEYEFQILSEMRGIKERLEVLRKKCGE